MIRRNIASPHCKVLFFGGDEYEGIGAPYSIGSRHKLLDGDGDPINTRKWKPAKKLKGGGEGGGEPKGRATKRVPIKAVKATSDSEKSQAPAAEAEIKAKKKRKKRKRDPNKPKGAKSGGWVGR